MKRHIFTVSILLVAAQLFGQESRFWVGGSGSWTDESHWSTTSGGEPGASVPESGTNVVFDENSFSGARNTVSFSDAVQVGSFTATDANFALSGKKDFTVSGSINVDANADFGKLRGALVLSGEGNHTINIIPIVPSDFIVDGGSWTLDVPLAVDGVIKLKSGSLNANGHSISCAEFSATEKAKMLNIEKSTVVCDKWNFRSASNLTLEAENSKILFRDTPQGNFFTVDGLKYGVIGTYRASKASLTASSTPVSCPENAQTVREDGTITVDIDGDEEYLILLSEIHVDENGDISGKSKTKVGTHAVFTNVPAGTNHTVSYREAGGMSAPQNVTVGYAPKFSGGIVVATGATCWGDDLILTHNITGGTGEYSFTWENNGGGYGSSATYTAIAGKTNFLTIEDENHCEYVAEKFAYRPTSTSMNDYTGGPERITATFDNEATCEGEETGVIHINASGGTGALSYSYAGPDSHSGTTDSPDISGLPAGEYDILISDGQCTNLTNATKLKSPNDLKTTITSIPAPVANAGADVSICEDELTFTVVDATAENAASISWSVSGPASITSGGDTETPTISFEGVGDVKLKMTVNNGTCTPATSTKIINIIEKPTPTNTTVSAEVCGLSTPVPVSATLSHGGTPTWKSAEGGITFANPNAATTTMTATAAGTYHVYVEEDNGCLGISGQVEVIFRDAPTVTITTGTSGKVCGDKTISLSATSNCTNVKWSGGAGKFSPDNSLNTVYTPGAADYGKTITLTLTATSNHPTVCTAPETATFELTVGDVPAPSIDALGDICGLSTTATAHATLGGTLTWNKVSGLTISPSTGASVTLGGSNGSSYSVTVTETTTEGCSATSLPQSVTFHKVPEVTVPSPDDICETGEVEVTATATDATDLVWTKTSGSGTLTQTGTSSSKTAKFVPSAADQDVTLTATASNGGICAAVTGTYTFHVYANPTPSIASAIEICGTTDVITANMTTAGNTVVWNASAGVTLTDQSESGTTATITATLNEGAAYGTYAITMTETNGANCSATVTTNVTFKEKPIMEFEEYEATICAGDDYIAKAKTHKNYVNAMWIASDGGTLNGTGYARTYHSTPSDTWKQITIECTPTDGCEVPEPQVMTLTINPNPAPNIENATVCGLEYPLPTIASSVKGIGSDISWSTPDASGKVKIQGGKFIATEEGTYKLQLSEAVGLCEESDEADITFVAEPEIFDAINDEVCADQATYPLSAATADHYTSLLWTSSGNGTFDNAATLNPTYTFGTDEIAAGSVTLTLTLTPNAPCTDPISSSVTITIDSLPVPKIMADDEICQDKTGTYTTESGMTNYYWSVDGGTPESGTETFEYTWTTDGAHKVSVSYTDGKGCTAAAATDFDLTVHDLPTSALSATANSCTNGSVGLDATASGGSGIFSYAWSGDGADYLDDDKGVTPTFTCTTAGTYNLTCTISDETYGCSKDFKVVITNTQGPSAFAGKDTTICYGSEYTLLDASFENGTTITWSSKLGGTFGDINDLHTTYKPSDADLSAHKATLTLTVDSESCGTTTDEVIVNILPEFVVAVGGIIPFPIAPSTKVEVEVVGSIVEAYDLGYYLVAPDGTDLKLYDHKEDKGMEDMPGLWPAAGDEFNFIFTTSPANELDLAQFTMKQPQSGTFGITGDVSGIYGKNPAEGGWAVRVGGRYSTGGKLQQAVIKFTDYNYDGDLQTITFDSRELNPVEIIPDHHTLSYISPIGLNVTCYGGNDARAVANAIGGSGIYNIFEWAKDEGFNDLVSDNDTTDLYAGTYYVRVTDSHGCKATTTVEVGQPAKIQISKLSQTDVACYGDSTASIEVTSANGVGIVTYQWLDSINSNNGAIATTALAENLYAGKFTVVATDENQCSVDSTFEITQPDSISIGAVVTLTPCGTTDGEVQFTISGGTQGKSPASKYTITCTDAGAVIDNNALKVTNLIGGSITFTITDANGCSKDTTINTNPDPMTLSFVADSIKCYDGTTSIAVVIVEGGEPGFSFEWNSDNTLTDSILSDVKAGKYYVDVTDANGCPASDTIIIGQPLQISDTIIFTQAIKCYGDKVASFYAEAEGGTPDKGRYKYTWFDVANNKETADSVLSNVGAGTYIVMVTDSNKCQISDTVTIVYPDSMYISKVDTISSECATPTGQAEVTVVGGVGPRNYEWVSLSDGITKYNSPTASSVTNMGADQYLLTVTDSLGCTVDSIIKIKDTGGLSVRMESVEDLYCIGRATGEVKITKILDKEYNDYTVNWVSWPNDSNKHYTDTVKNLGYGTNYITVVASNLCRTDTSIVMDDKKALRFDEDLSYVYPDVIGGDPYNNGEIRMVAMGGKPDYTYKWSDIEGNEITSNIEADGTIIRLKEGKYIVEVSDQNIDAAGDGCIIKDTLEIVSSPIMVALQVSSTITCFGYDDGALRAVVSGGNKKKPYEYEWYNYDSDTYTVFKTDKKIAIENIADSLLAGNYRVRVSQFDGLANDTADIVLTEPKRLHVMEAVLDDPENIKGSQCYNSVGEIRIKEPSDLQNKFGGTLPYTYTFFDSEGNILSVAKSGTNPQVKDLSSGSYTLQLVDTNLCVWDTIIEVPDLTEFEVKQITTSEPICYGDSTGVITLKSSANGATADNFKYEWSVGGKTIATTEPSIGDLVAGTYSAKVTVTIDTNTCVKTIDTLTVEQYMPITFSVSNTILSDCYNTNGIVTIDALQGGRESFGRFQFFADGTQVKDSTLLNIVTVKDSARFDFSLPVGKYNVIVTDGNLTCRSEATPVEVKSQYPEIMVLKVDLSLPLCDTYTADGAVSIDGSLNVTAFYSVSSTITGVDTIENTNLRYRIDGGKVQSSGQFNGLASGRHTITIGYGDTLSCSTTVSRKLGSRNGFAIDDIYFANTQTDEIFTCPDNELKAFAHTTSAYTQMKWYTPYVEEEEEEEPAVAPDTTNADSTRIDTALAISKMRHFFLRANGDSTEVDSVITDNIPTDSVPVAEEPVKPRYVIDADGNVVLGVDSVGSEPDFILPFTFLPYGGDTYYYVKATNGVCMAIDSLHAVSMKPDNKLKTHIEMDGFDSEALKNNGVYEVAEGAELYLVANTLTFDMLYSYEYENNFQWATNTDNAFWMSSHDTMPAVVRPFAENLTFKVSDSVMFYLEDTTFACRYTESVDVRTVSGIKPADVFTPNGDAYNETWGIDGLSSYEHVNIYVFNRWGGRVWQFSGSGLEYAANQWNGRNAKNKPLPSGTYYYVIQCSSDKLGGKKKTGPVTIVR